MNTWSLKTIKSTILLLLIAGAPAISQQYYSKLIPFDYGSNISPNPNKMLLVENYALISVLRPINNSTLIKINLESDALNYFDYDNFVVAADPFLYINGNLFMYGKDRSLSDDLRVLKLDEFYQVEDTEVFNSSNAYTFPLNSCVIGGNMFISSFHDNEDSDGSNVRGVNIRKLNEFGEEIWSGEFGEGIKNIYSWKLVPYIQNSLLMSTAAHKDFKIVSQLYTVNFNLTNQHFEAEEGAQNGSKSHPIVVLNNDIIVLNNTVSRSWDLEFIQNDWYPFPPKFSWINTQGENIKDTLLITDESEELFIHDIEVGKGDYFYGYGTWIDDDADLHYGWIIKMSNEGDVIWSKKYLHPSLSDPGLFHDINDIIELDNGDIIALGLIREPGKVNRIWSMKVNEHGCFGEEICADELITSIDEKININQNRNGIQLYPNPASHAVRISALEEQTIVKIKVVALDGNSTFEKCIDSNEYSLNIENFVQGIYLVNITLDNGDILSEKLLIQN